MCEDLCQAGWEYLLINDDTSLKNIQKEAEKKGLRRPTYQEAMAFSREFGQELRKHQVAFLTSGSKEWGRKETLVIFDWIESNILYQEVLKSEGDCLREFSGLFAFRRD